MILLIHTPAAVLVEKAKAFATKAHEGLLYGDHPYTYHLSQVADNVYTRMKDDSLLSVYLAVAWLHDTIEDTDVTYENIYENFGAEISDAVRRLTKTKNLTYSDYLIQCIESPIAREVKICDTMANLVESFKTNNTKGLKKYPRQLDYLIKGEYYE